MGKKTSVYIPDEVAPLIQKYSERHGSLRRAIVNALQVMDTMYKLERRVLRDLFTQQEMNLMLNNAMSTAYVPQAIPGAVLGSTEDETDSNFAYFGVDRAALLEKLRGLALSQQFALVDWLIELRGNEEKEAESVD
jgi:hypothetical protein